MASNAGARDVAIIDRFCSHPEMENNGKRTVGGDHEFTI